MDSTTANFAKRLAGNEKKQRDSAIGRLRKYLSLKADLGEGDLLKLWKGLHYCLWMQDKPLLQEQLVSRIVGLVDCQPSQSQAFLFLRTGFLTEGREWNKIDLWRLDKFMMLVRQMTRRGLQLLHKNSWSADSVKQWNALVAHVMGHEDDIADGLRFHIADIYLDEVARVGGHDLSQETILSLLQPFQYMVCRGKNKVLVKRVLTNVLQPLCRDLPTLEMGEDVGESLIPNLQVSTTSLTELLMGWGGLKSSRNRALIFRLVRRMRDAEAGLVPGQQEEEGEDVTDRDVDRACQSLQSFHQRLFQAKLRHQEKKKQKKKKKEEKTEEEEDDQDEATSAAQWSDNLEPGETEIWVPSKKYAAKQKKQQQEEEEEDQKQQKKKGKKIDGGEESPGSARTKQKKQEQKQQLEEEDQKQQEQQEQQDQKQKKKRKKVDGGGESPGSARVKQKTQKQKQQEQLEDQQQQQQENQKQKGKKGDGGEQSPGSAIFGPLTPVMSPQGTAVRLSRSKASQKAVPSGAPAGTPASEKKVNFDLSQNLSIAFKSTDAASPQPFTPAFSPSRLPQTSILKPSPPTTRGAARRKAAAKLAGKPRTPSPAATQGRTGVQRKRKASDAQTPAGKKMRVDGSGSKKGGKRASGMRMTAADFF